MADSTATPPTMAVIGQVGMPSIESGVVGCGGSAPSLLEEPAARPGRGVDPGVAVAVGAIFAVGTRVGRTAVAVGAGVGVG